MGLPIFDCAVRTSVVALGGAMVQLVPPAAALGTGRMIRLKQLTISNTTATGFPVGLGIATAAAVSPATGGTIVRRSNSVGAVDPASTAAVWTTFGTTPTAPTGFNARLWVPGSSMLVWGWNEGEELMVPPASTPLPFCIFVPPSPNATVGQVAEVSMSWEE